MFKRGRRSNSGRLPIWILEMLQETENCAQFRIVEKKVLIALKLFINLSCYHDYNITAIIPTVKVLIIFSLFFLSLSRNYFESYAHAREWNIQSHTANCPTRLVTLAHNRSSSHLLSHLPRDTSTYGHQQYSYG
ncbi:hypothetical protein NQ318_019026 [Aromia moschata]|uniref:Uncharacterized protein n=1 Tax=Aromia moschata TaxID=1265417 RepID=A0AAV8Y295_9CUCU|nr:hypothetical protein NQ318_019026 [Aromia moschata]